MSSKAPVPNPAASGTCPDWPAWVRNRLHVAGASRQTRPGQPAAKKHGTASAGLAREYGMRLEKTRKSLPAVARLQAGRGFRAGLQAGHSRPPKGGWSRRERPTQARKGPDAATSLCEGRSGSGSEKAEARNRAEAESHHATSAYEKL